MNINQSNWKDNISMAKYVIKAIEYRQWIDRCTDPHDEVHPDTVYIFRKKGRVVPILHYSCSMSYFYIVKQLVKCGANLGRKCSIGATPLGYAMNPLSSSDLVRWILDQPEGIASIDALNNNGTSVLHYCMAVSNFDMVWTLFKYGANPNLITDGDSIMSLALMHRDKLGVPLYWLEKYGIGIVCLVERYMKMYNTGEWRPWNHHMFCRKTRDTMKTLLLLAKCIY